MERERTRAADAARTVTSGTVVPIHGNDLDTDRIIPARFLTSITFDGLGRHIFVDDRADQARAGRVHPLDAPHAKRASILFVNKNFGCGSSREHAPQALAGWGFRAVVGESFAEIFFGNCVSIGIPCVTLAEGDVERLMAVAEARPELECSVDLESMVVRLGEESAAAALPASARELFITGRWDSTAELLVAKDEIRRIGPALPYWNGWS